jgi:ankyrin repeat protein
MITMVTIDIHKSARLGHLDAFRQAVQHGANINAQDEFGSTPLQVAIAEKQLAAAALLLELGADATIQDPNGSTALHWAIEHDLPDVLETLVRKCSSAVSISDKHGNQPLWTASFKARGDYRMVRLLLRCGADPEHRNNANLRPIDIAKKKGDADLLRLLENRASGES